MVPRNYIRPDKTHQELLTDNDIKEKLKNYKHITDVSNIDIGSHVRYFTIDPITQTKKFRLGGIVNSIDPQFRYIKLSNGNISWSVQLNNIELYKKLSEDELYSSIRNKVKNELLSEDAYNTKYLNKESSIQKNDLKQYESLVKNQEKIINKYKQDIAHYEQLKLEYESLKKKYNNLHNKLKQIEDEIVKSKYKH